VATTQDDLLSVAFTPEETSSHELTRIFNLQKEAFRKNPFPSLSERRANLDALFALVKDNQAAFIEAINQDFGCRSAYETKISEINLTLEDIRYIRRKLSGWMRASERLAPIWFLPARAQVIRQPLGVIGMIGPWNFPMMLALMPLSAALAAGNRVMLKMSEFTPATDALVSRLIKSAFSEDQVAVVSGGPETARAMTHMPFDKLMYTGSPARATEVLHATAENLTPVLLELGGKNPAIVHRDFPLAKAVERIMSDKLFNAGQSCISIDYAFVPEDMVEDFLKAAKADALAKYPTMVANPDYTSIINDRHYRRVMGYIEDARAKGAQIVEVIPDGDEFGASSRKIPPTFILGADDSMIICQEEIFGPALVIKPYRELEEAIEYVNARPRPLALYYFDHNSGRAQDVLRRTVSGTAAVNDAVWQFCVHELPFGGVGHSGMGSYHGEHGFNAFSHHKGVFYQTELNQLWTVKPPYSKITDFMLKLMIR